MNIPKKIILISVDTLRADHLGCYGYNKRTSSAIDAFAKNSILVSHAFSASSFTIPSHASIFTGKYPSHHSIGFNQVSGKLDTDVDTTLAEILKAHNYSTAAFVSCLILRKETNLGAGFDVYDDNMPSKLLNRPDILIRDGTQTLAKSLEWISEHKYSNFFVFIHLFDTHGPYHPSEEYVGFFREEDYPELYKTIPPGVSDWGSAPPRTGEIPRHQLLVKEKGNTSGPEKFETNLALYVSRYDSCIRKTDENLNNFFTQLKNDGLYDDCLIILTADHGESLGENDIYFCHGFTVTPDQIQVPLIIKPFNGWNVAQRKIEIPVSSVDITPTILELCGIKSYLENLDGISILSALENDLDKKLTDRVIIAENERQIAYIYQDLSINILKKQNPNSTHYPSIPDVIEKLRNVNYCYPYLSGKKEQ